MEGKDFINLATDLRNRLQGMIGELDTLLGQAPEKPKRKRKSGKDLIIEQIRSKTWRKPQLKKTA